jgi:uncharacterized membrane protein YfcA
VTPADALLAAGAGVLAGAVNAVAGGGTLISFPALVALGVPSNAANATNTVALCAGYFTGARAQRAELAHFDGQKQALVTVGAIGGLLGAILLTISDEKLFSNVVPFLILLACALLAGQPWIRKLAARRGGGGGGDGATHAHTTTGLAAIGLTAVYGGYFGAGIGIVLLAVLGVLFTLPMSRVNALKGLLQLTINGVAAMFLAIGGDVRWAFVVPVAAGSLVGGWFGGKLAPKLNPTVIRIGVVILGLVVAIRFWL